MSCQSECYICFLTAWSAWFNCCVNSAKSYFSSELLPHDYDVTVCHLAVTLMTKQNVQNSKSHIWTLFVHLHSLRHGTEMSWEAKGFTALKKNILHNVPWNLLLKRSPFATRRHGYEVMRSLKAMITINQSSCAITRVHYQLITQL